MFRFRFSPCVLTFLDYSYNKFNFQSLCGFIFGLPGLYGTSGAPLVPVGAAWESGRDFSSLGYQVEERGVE